MTRVIRQAPLKRHASLPAPPETAIQSSFISWVRYAEKTDWRLKLLFAVPNGGHRSKVTAAIMKREGQRAGVPDTILPYPAGPFVGLAIEFKRPGKPTTESQDKYIPLLEDAGWLVTICTDADQAIKTVTDYLAMTC